MPPLSPSDEAKLVRFARALIDQKQARTIVPPKRNESGYWFGGGNLIKAENDRFLLVGRFRNSGDSRVGTSAGTRGFELALFESRDECRSFEQRLAFSKADLSSDQLEVVSIEGSALRWSPDGVELFISTEKAGVEYPPGLQDYLKKGTGVWTIDVLSASDVEGLSAAQPTRVVGPVDARFSHVKDPFVFDSPQGRNYLLFCTHPFCWTSSNTAYVVRQSVHQEYAEPCFDFFPRGVTWDVAITRGTCVLQVPPIGAFNNKSVALMFYDGGECVRDHEQHANAVQRPRGYSCEELSSAAYFIEGDLHSLHRLSVASPLFVSPQGTGCSRYVDVLSTPKGFYATWQQSQADGSQPLVMNFLPAEEAAKLLS